MYFSRIFFAWLNTQIPSPPSTSHHVVDLPQVQLGDDDAVEVVGEIPHRPLGKREDRDEPQMIHLPAVGTSHPHRSSGRPRRDPVGHDADLGALLLIDLDPGEALRVVADLVHQPPHQPRVLLGVVGRRQPALVVGEAGDVRVEPTAEIGHLGDRAPHRTERDVGPRLVGRRAPLHELDLVFGGQDDLLAHVADLAVGHDQDRIAVLLGEVEGEPGQVDALLDRGRRQGDDLVIAVGPPPCLQHVALGGLGRLTGGRSGSLDIDDHARRLGHAGIADPLLHQREAGAAGGGEGTAAGPGGTDHGGQGRDFVLHLHHRAAQAGQQHRHRLRHFSGRGNGVAGEEVAAAEDRAVGASHVPLRELLPRSQDLHDAAIVELTRHRDRPQSSATGRVRL
jgi:hypothetical protein